MKKIALFINSLQKGGSVRVIVNLAEYFHGKGYEVLLVTQYKREVEYDINPADIKMELRLYQTDEVQVYNPEPDNIRFIFLCIL